MGTRPPTITPRELVHILLIVAALVRLGLAATVLPSIFFHAFSASPGIELYARQIAWLGADATEYEKES